MTDPKRSIYQQNLSNKKPHIYLHRNQWMFSPVMYNKDWLVRLRLNGDASEFCTYLNNQRKQNAQVS